MPGRSACLWRAHTGDQTPMTTEINHNTHHAPLPLCHSPDIVVVEPSTIYCIPNLNTYPNTTRRNISTHNTSTNAAKYHAAAFSTVRILTYPSVSELRVPTPAPRCAPDRRASGKDGHLWWAGLLVPAAPFHAERTIGSVGPALLPDKPFPIRRRAREALIRSGEAGPLVTMACRRRTLSLLPHTILSRLGSRGDVRAGCCSPSRPARFNS